MKIFYPIFFLAVTNKLIEHEFGNRNRYCSEIIVCILFILYAIRYNAYVINYTYIITLLLLDFLFFPLLILLIRKSTHFQNRRPLQVCEKKNFLYWHSIIDLAFIICVNIKINGHFFAIEYVVRNSFLKKYLSVDNFRYIYNIFITTLLIYIVKAAYKLKSNVSTE